MRFDDFWTDDRASSEPLPLAADGRHTGEITSAKEKRLDFMKSDQNRDGTSLVVTVEIPKAQPIESIVPCHFRGKVEALCRAAGVALPANGEDWDEQVLVGRTVTVETTHAVSKSGKEYVRIDRWHPSPSKPLPKSAAPARSQTAQAHREFTSNATNGDDIPF